ncbi:helicase-exonuclease AddAB subunit AddB [Peptoclostridium litorale]|nr:helicase-exonuclease AddAB subunit AddB [Peptoclostridium litorale]
MGFRYILGRAGSGKTHKIYEEIVHSLKCDPDKKLILMVPEQFTLQAETDIINSSGLEGIMQVEVLSFQRLAHRILSEVGGIKRVQISQIGKVMRLRSLFETYSKELNIYSKVSRQEGFLSMCADLIDDMRKARVEPQEIVSLDSEIEDEILSRKLSEIGLIYSKYVENISQSYMDEHDGLRLLAQGIGRSEFLEGAVVWMDGFSGFTENELEVIRSLVNKVDKVNISLTANDKRSNDYDLFLPTRTTLERLMKIGKEEGVSQGKTVSDGMPQKPAELLHVEKNIYSYPYSRYAKDLDSIGIFAGGSRQSEIENCAIKILKLARESGYRWNDMAIVTGAMQDYSKIIKRVFAEYGIPFFIDEKRSVTNNPIIRFVGGAIDIVTRGFRYEDVFRYVKTGFTDLERFEWEHLENYCLKYGIKSKMWLEEFRAGEDDEREMAENARKKLIVNFEDFMENMSGRHETRHFVKALYEFLVGCKTGEKIENWIETLREEGRLEYVNENTQIWNMVMEIFDQLVEIMGDHKVDKREFSSILSAGFTECRIGVIPPAMDQVLVGSLERSKSHSIKALFVVGVNDGVIPGGFMEEGLFQDDEKLRLKAQGVNMGTDSLIKSAEEKFSIYTSLAKPSRYLYLSHAISDEEGKALRPSVLIERFKKLFPKIQESSDVSKEDICETDFVSRPLPTLRHMVRNIREQMDVGGMDELWWDVYSWYEKSEYWKDRLDFLREGFFHSNQQAYMGESFAGKLYSLPLRSSISRLEKFVNCPFSYFVNYGLTPKERSEYTVSMPDIGTIFHNSVEEFAKELSNEGIGWSSLERAKSDEIIEKVIDKVVDKFGNNVLESSSRYKYLVNKIKRVGKRAAWTLVEHVKRGEFTPLGHEIEFSDSGFEQDDKIVIPPIVIELANGDKIELEGRIDRVDILQSAEGGYVKIIDYKSGNKKFTLSDAYYGLQIQLIVYMDALLENRDILQYDELHPAGMFYFKIDDPMVDAAGIDPGEIESQILKKLKMNGIVLKDAKIVKAMDIQMEEGGYSDIVPAHIKKDGTLSSRSSAIDEEDFGKLIKHVKNLICEIGAEILKGNIKVNPCKDGQETSCKYCKFSSICQFDTSLDGNEYRNIKSLSDEQVVNRIRDEEKEGEEHE